MGPRPRSCRECEAHLLLGPRLVLRASVDAWVVLIGQAPGTKVHNSGIEWNDASGDRLRNWLGMDRDTFYATERLAIIPMAFCYLGQAANGGDNPPCPECAPLWHGPLLEALPNLDLTVLIGSYDQKYYLGNCAELERLSIQHHSNSPPQLALYSLAPEEPLV
jgi:uracil-DNA glycosylase